MSVRILAVTVPAALIALGLVASSTAATSQISPEAPAVSRSDAWAIEKAKVGYKKKRRRSAWKRKGRFSGFGFRGDGFRTSGQNQ